MSYDYKLLMDNAKQASKNSYSPFSRFAVGACVLASSGKTYNCVFWGNKSADGFSDKTNYLSSSSAAAGNGFFPGISVCPISTAGIAGKGR